MNPRNLVIGSLVLNLALAGAAFALFQRRDTAVVTTTPAAVVDAAKPTESSVAAESLTNGVASTNSSEKLGWETLQSKDLRTYIEHLRSVDCPEETIRDVITAEVNKLFAKRLRAIRQASQPEHKYWESGRNIWNAKGFYEQQKQIRAIQKEQSAMLIDLLGVDPNAELNKENGYGNFWQRNLEFLPEDKRDQVSDIQMKFTEEQQKLYRRGTMDDEDQKKVRELYQQSLTELAAVLSPSELAEYDIRSSQLSQQLRYELDLFNPTEEDFRKIYAIRKAREEDLVPIYDRDDKVAMQRREKAVNETDEQIKAMLGEERFALYKRAPDYNYRELVNLVEREQLPRENAENVYNLKKQVEDNAGKLRSSSEYTQAQKTEMLKKLREDTEKQITAALGEKGWKKYNQRQGWWLNSIAPQERKSQ